MANTLNYGFPKPDIANNIDEEFYVFRDTTLDMIDAAIKAVADAAAAKAALVHSHEIDDVTGLAGALAGKMSADTTFSLDSLTDVDGAAGAAVNSVLVKNSSGQWVPSSALAALGPHGHTISEITGLGDVLVSKADGAAVASALGLKADKGVTVTGAGLASGGGDISANRVITVTKATDAEHQARVRDDVAATPKGVGLALAAYNKWETIEEVTLAAAASYIRTGLADFYDLLLDGYLIPSANASVTLTASSDNGVSWMTTADQVMQYFGLTSVNANFSSSTIATAVGFLISSGAAFRANDVAAFECRLHGFNKVQRLRGLLNLSAIESSSIAYTYTAGYWSNDTAPGRAARSAIRLLPSAGSMSGKFTLAGKRG